MAGFSLSFSKAVLWDMDSSSLPKNAFSFPVRERDGILQGKEAYSRYYVQ